MKTILLKYWIALLFIVLIINIFAEQEPLLPQIGREFFSGLLKSNYREVPINQFISLQRLTLAEIRYPPSPAHPSLLFDSASISRIRNRRLRQPFQAWQNNLISTALSSPHDPASPFLSEKNRARFAKLNAFCWFLSNQQHFRQSAITALLNITEIRPPVNGEGGIPGVGWGDWMEAADALQNYAVAYDLVYHDLSESERKQIEAKLAAKIAQIHRYYIHIPRSTDPTDITLGLGIPKNNHIIQIAIGVATAALVLDHPRSAVWFEDSLQEMQAGLALILPDGCYQEGPYYARFINYHLFTFFFYLQNTTGHNLFNHPQIQKMNTWLIDLELPDGSLPLIDDSFDDVLLYKPIGVGLSPQEAELSYLFENQVDRYRRSDPNWVEAFCAFDDRVRPRQPDYNSFYPDGGYAILRGKNEIAGTLAGQPGRPFISYHDHIEPASFTCYAFGRHWLIEGGYGPRGVNDVNRNWFTSARSHNIPLVNGFGPDQNPIWGDDLNAEMSDSFRMQNLTASTVRANYRDADIQRKVWLINQEFFLIYDQISSSGINRYAVPWQSLGELQLLSENKMIWRQDDAELQAEFLSLEPKPFKLIQRIGLNTYRHSPQHSIAEIGFSPASEARLVSLFLPQETFHKDLHSEVLSVNSAGRTAARMITKNRDNSITRIILAESSWQLAEIESDAALAIIQQNGFETIITVQAATFFKIHGEYFFSADEKIDLTFNLNDFCGYLTLKTLPTEIKFNLNHDPGIIILDRLTLDYRHADDGIIVKPNRSGVLQFGKLVCDIETAIPVRSDLPLLERLAADAYPQREFQQLNYYEKTQLRNEIIGIAAPQTISSFNQMIGYPHIVQNLYNFSSGFSRSSYSDSENFIFRIPQSFGLQRKFGNSHFQYFEEGFYTTRGMEINRHRLWARNQENMLYYSFDRDLQDYQIHSLQLNYRQYYSRTDWQKYADDNAYLIELRREHQTGYIGLSHQQNELSDTQNNNLSFQNGNLFTSLHHSSLENDYEYRFQSNSCGQNLSFSLESVLSPNDGLQQLNISKATVISRNTRFNAGMQLQDRTVNNKLDLSLYATFVKALGRVSSTTDFQRDFKQNYFLRNRTNLRLSNWHLAATTHMDSRLRSEFDIAYRQQNFSSRFSWQKANLLDWQGSCDLNSIWNVQTAVNWDWQEAVYRQARLGFLYNGRQRTGAQIAVKNNSNRKSYGLAAILELSLLTKEIVNISSEFFWKADGALESYDLDITQIGRTLAPGILIRRDGNKLIRCEGYLIWKF